MFTALNDLDNYHTKMLDMYISYYMCIHESKQSII